MALSTTNALPLVLILLLAATLYAEAGTIFKAIVPTACVGEFLGPAGRCVLEKGCYNRCFNDGNPNVGAANVLSLNSDALRNFYIPVDAVECYQLEDPICPATKCCPACKEELDGLFQCMILEADYHYLDYLARTCPLDCPDPTPSPTKATRDPTPNPTSSPTLQIIPLNGTGTGNETLTTTSVSTNPLPSTNATGVDVEPIVEVGFETNFTMCNSSFYNSTSNLTLTNCTMSNFTNVTTEEENTVETTDLVDNESVNTNPTGDESTPVVTTNNNGPEDDGTASTNPSTVASTPIKPGTITYVSTPDSVLVINHHDNTTTVLENGAGINPIPATNPPSSEEEGATGVTTTDNIPEDNGPPIDEGVSISNVRPPITIVSTNDSVTMVDSHHNEMTALDSGAIEGESDGMPTVNDGPTDNEEVETDTDIEVIQVDMEKDVILIVSNPNSVTIIDSHHSTTTSVDTKPP